MPLGSGKSKVLHVMTNSYPAKKLDIRYKVHLSAVRVLEREPGVMETPRQTIRRQANEVLLENAAEEIRKAISQGAKQVIYFAQDKLFLESLCKILGGEKELGLNTRNVEILSSSVLGSKRKKLIEEETRDSIKVFLMTSSAARGVSFPKADWIIAAVLRFNIESALMEIAQLIYRGRGSYTDEDGTPVSGDLVLRKLVMLVDDFLVHDKALDTW